MKTIKYLALFTFLLSAVFAFNTNISAQTKSEILIVADQKASCRGIVAQDCLQVKHLNEERFGLFRQNIEGFNFVPGYFYVLDVQTINVKNPPAEKYRLKKVLVRVKAESNSTTPNLPTSNQTNLSGTEWKLTKIKGNAVQASKAFIRFDESKNSIGGNGGCNVFGGSMEKNGNQIKFSKVFSTKMYCEGMQDVENKFLGNLERVTKYEIKSGKLLLIGNNKTLLEFEAKN